jgi:hypothetical protein
MSETGTLLARYKRRGVLVDSNLLLLLFIGIFDPARIKKFKRTVRFSEADFSLLVNFLASFEKTITTPHILTEVSNLAGQLDSTLLPGFYSVYAASIQRMEEVNRPSIEIVQADIFNTFGLTDSVIGLVANTPFLVLTDDLRLAAFLAHKKIDVVPFDVVRSIAGLG